MKAFGQDLVTQALVKENLGNLLNWRDKRREDQDKRKEEGKNKRKKRGKKQATKAQQTVQQEKEGHEDHENTHDDNEGDDDNEDEGDDDNEDEGDDDNDAMIYTIDGDGADEDGDPDQIEIVPRLKTVTRHGRIAGTLQRRFSDDTSSDSDPDNDTPEPQQKEPLGP